MTEEAKKKAKKKAKIDKEKKIDKEVSRLTKLFKEIEQNKLKTANSLIRNAAFMTITLDELQEAINENGVIDQYKNGENQWGTKKSPAVEIYNTMVKNHSSIMKQLTDLLPKENPDPDPDDGFDEFVDKK